MILARGLDAVGTGRQIDLLARGLAAAGREVHVATTTGGGSLAMRAAATGLPVHALGLRPVADAATAVALCRLVGRLRPATLIAFGRRQAWLAAATRWVASGTRRVAHVAVPVRHRDGWPLARMDRVVATSETVAASCARAGVAAAQIGVISPGIVAGERRFARPDVAARLGLDVGARWTLCVAPLVAESRLERLLWGIDQLGVVCKGLQHVLVGAGPQLARVQRRARVQELAERLFMVPHSDVADELVAEAALVWQSGSIACGGAILDAMPWGVPAVAVESDAACQLVEHGVSGWLVPPLPESEFPRRAFTLLDDEGPRMRFGDAARERAATVFPADRMIARFVAEIDALD
ncbi:MAG: glycosyltransferase [Pirellulales bacterium]